MEDLLQLLAVVSAIVAGIFVVHYFQYRTAVAQAGVNSRRAAPTEDEPLQREVAALRKRIEILERIVTDARYALQDEISNL